MRVRPTPSVASNVVSRLDRDKEIPTNKVVQASRYDSALGRKVTERILTDTLYSTKSLPPIGRRGSERLYDLVDNICPEAGDIVRKAGREVGLDLGRNWNWNERECILWI